MDVNYETDISTSYRSLETEYYDSTTVDYSENNSSELVAATFNVTDDYAGLPDWRENFWALFDERYLFENLGWTITLIVAYSLLFFIGFFGNSMVILVVIRRPKMRTVTNLFIMNLAVADLLLILFCIPTELLDKIFQPWILGPVMCKIAYYMMSVSLCASAYSLAAISIDRCKAIYHSQVPPRGLSKRQVLFTIGLIWTVSLSLPIPLAMVNVMEDDDTLFPICIERWGNVSNRKIYFLVVVLFLFYCWPLILILISNVIIWWTVSSRKAPEDCAHASGIGRMHRKTRQSVGKMLGTVTLVFLLSWLPFYAYFSYSYIFNKSVDSEVNDFIVTLLPLLYSSNSSINPVLYAFLSKKFREALKSLLPQWLPSMHGSENNCEKSCSSRDTTTNDITPKILL